MDEARLSAHERRVLAEIEQDLSADDDLARRMTGRRSSPHRPAPPRPSPHRSSAHLPSLHLPRPRIAVRDGLGAAVFGAATLALLVLAVATLNPALIWGFAATWVVTLTLLLRLVVRRFQRRAGAGRPDDD
ncbi:DUF3040 domain-containing protein [Streptomyces sp. NPDC058486]|uniref:DUF3040 domain-containing protein n=1 Tax=unclassified Streptomyces TaxID=2593676 RepID=UPI0036531D63